jgi:hypothetical protein
MQFQLFFLIVSPSYCTLIQFATILIPLPALNAAGIVGVQVKSQYLPEVATVHKLGVQCNLE